jgi:carboxyl-terminal processing protease
MKTRFAGRTVLGLTAAAVLGVLSPAASLLAQATATAHSASALEDISSQVWTKAKAGRNDDVVALLSRVPAVDEPGAAALREQARLLEKNLSKREEDRAKKLAEVDSKLDEQLKKGTPESLSEAVKFAVERYVVSKASDREAFKHDPKIVDLVKRAADAARAAEAKGDWFTANELFYRLNALMEEEATFKDDVKRLGQRLMMIRLYAPEEFWTLRNNERLKDKKSPLPPYNGLGEDFRDKIMGINPRMVLAAVWNASQAQVENVGLRDALAGGVEALKVMATTPDLRKPFPGLADDAKRAEWVKFLDGWKARLDAPGFAAGQGTLRQIMDEAVQTANATVAIPENAVLHEFGNGAMSKMDEFSAIIWPDELARFDRMTSGQFVGIGVQIQLDEESQMIKVVTPLEGTPAQRAGVRAGDLIKKINGDSAVGITLNQAVDKITGNPDTSVTITMERKTGKNDPDGKEITQDVDFRLVRATIPVASVKGWKRTGAREDDWDWYVDPENRIGYVRLTQFTEDTTRDLQKAIKAMQADRGLSGLILDLRFNPGGLLTEAVGVANTFIERGTIVSTRGRPGGLQGETKSASAGNAIVKGVPLAVLINEGSASASEIVSGALRHYADTGDLNAIIIGRRSFGKGSVQNVWPLAPNAKMKLTTQYYYLPDGHRLHRTPGAKVWGVEPHLLVDMLPETETEALKLRQDADVLPIDQNGKVIAGEKTPDPAKLLTDGLDVQLQTALVLLQSEATASAQAQARGPEKAPRHVE